MPPLRPAIEAWRAWAVSRVAKREHLARAPIPDSPWDRFLRPLERRGSPVIAGYMSVRGAPAAEPPAGPEIEER